jgi:hypothetical protein
VTEGLGPDSRCIRDWYPLTPALCSPEFNEAAGPRKDTTIALSQLTPGAFVRQVFPLPSHSSGNPANKSSNRSSAGCRPSRIASTMSGASSVSRNTRLT